MHLYIDTALSPLTMHLCVGEEGAVFSFVAEEHRASDSLHVELKALLDRSSQNISDLKVLTLVRGPGSFTGVRIAYTLAEALKLSLPDLETHAITTLEALAYTHINHLPEGEPVQVVTNAHGGKAFVQKVQREGEGEGVTLLSDVSCVSLEDLPEISSLADPILDLPHNVLSEKTPLSLSAKGMQKATVSSDYTPLYVKPLIYRKLSDVS